VIDQRTSGGLLVAGCIEDDRCDDVRLDVGGRSSVLNVALAISGSGGGGDSEGRGSVSCAVGEFGAARGFVLTGESKMIVFTVEADVKFMLGGKFGHHVLNILHATGSLTHGFCGEVGVSAGAIPLWEKFGGN